MKTVLDFRTIEPRARHALFLSVFEGLKAGTSFEFINDHDPAPLYRQLQSMNISNLEWKYSAKGPDLWVVNISKSTTGAEMEEGCCGICGGHGHSR
jgi:uncharacterized protein (DUF2249 family)